MSAYVGSPLVYEVGQVVRSFGSYSASFGNVQLPSGEPVLSPWNGTKLKSAPIFHWCVPPRPRIRYEKSSFSSQRDSGPICALPQPPTTIDGYESTGVHSGSRAVKSPGSQSPWLYGGATSYFAYAYWNRMSLSARGLTIHECPITAELRGTAKSKLFVGWVRPPVVMMGRYSSSAP